MRDASARRRCALDSSRRVAQSERGRLQRCVASRRIASFGLFVRFLFLLGPFRSQRARRSLDPRDWFVSSGVYRECLPRRNSSIVARISIKGIQDTYRVAPNCDSFRDRTRLTVHASETCSNRSGR